jgi:hypothetical protein
MTVTTNPTTGETWKIYRPNPSFKMGSVALSACFVPVMLLIPTLIIVSEYRQTGHVPLPGIGFVLLLALAAPAILWRAAQRERGPYLALSSAGIKFYAPGLTIKTAWDNVQSLRTGYVPVLILRKGAATHISIFYRRDWTTAKHIPLSWFDYAPHSALAADLRAFAPHLFIQAAPYEH